MGTKFGITVTAKLKHAGLWEAAKKHGSQSALAKLLGVDESRLGTWVNLQGVPSQRRMADPEFQAKVLLAVGQSVEDLFPQELCDAADFLAAPKRIEATQQIDLLRLAEVQGERLSLPSPEMSASLNEQAQAIAAVLKTIPERERQVITLRYGLDGHADGLTYDELSQVFKVTRERVRQLEMRAIRRLQQPTRASVLDAAFVEA